MSKKLIPFIFSFVFFLLSFSFGNIIRVPQDQASIQAGIDAAVNGDTVLVADSTYYENIDFKGKAIMVASHYVIDGDMTHIDSTVINGSQPSHADSGSVVYFISGEDTTSVLYGFTITGGTGTETTEDAYGTITPCRAGGGIFCNNGFAKIVHNKLINNTVISNDKEVFGGGLIALPFGSDAWLVLRNNQISWNMIKTTAGAALCAVGGGLEIGSNGILTNNLISFNSVVHNATGNNAGGGGFECATASSELRNLIVEFNTIIHNSVTSQSNIGDYPSAFGGGVSIWGRYRGRFTNNEVSNNEVWVNPDRNCVGIGVILGEIIDSLVFERNVIRENAVTQGTGWGGGLNISAIESLTLVNNIIDGNSATNGGGILITGNGTFKLINNSVINNQATSGGGMFIGYENSTNYLMNTIIWGNQAATNPAIHIETGTIQIAHSDVQGDTTWPGTGNINLDPQLDANGLSDSSPCIGAGAASFDFGGGMICYCPATDIAGNSRPDPVGSNPDMGAWESLLRDPLGLESLPMATIPQKYSLSQNYPNPFNPTTTIEFQIPKSELVTLKIYTLLGQEIATLVDNKRLTPGTYKYQWDASPTSGGQGVASGIYLYCLQAGNYTQTKKLILLR